MHTISQFDDNHANVITNSQKHLPQKLREVFGKFGLSHWRLSFKCPLFIFGLISTRKLGQCSNLGDIFNKAGYRVAKFFMQGFGFGICVDEHIMQKSSGNHAWRKLHLKQNGSSTHAMGQVGLSIRTGLTSMSFLSKVISIFNKCFIAG